MSENSGFAMALSLFLGGAVASWAARPLVRALTTSAPKPIKYIVLRYTYVENMLERRGPYRAEHLANAKAASEKGWCAIAGAYDPCDGAVLLFNADKCSVADVENFAKADPYVTAGLAQWNVVHYNAVCGTLMSKL
uniref:YCII-related domain-containing protein n=2 Tax=Phaeomonas parva TaxID=124430 RepID=A0A7S1XTY7_9STRA|mmetsp:Transcript_39141/g.122436  ORF Transcript_39141/g.122436 Transcript_39141/m.122436 type:complete len:136 (+) Transcript_39141:151-558(+)